MHPFLQHAGAFQQLVEHSKQPIIVIETGGRIVFANPAANALFQNTVKSVAGESFFKFLEKGQRAIFQIYLNDISRMHHQKGELIGLPRFDSCLAIGGQQLRQVEIVANLIQLDGIDYYSLFFNDVTVRREVESALKESESHYRQLFENDLTANFIMDRQGNILMCNPAYAMMFGFKDAATAQYSNFFLRFLTPEAGQQFLAQLNQHKKLALFETALQKLDGELIYVLANFVGEFDARNHLTLIKGYLLDISQRKQIEAQLMQAQKMESLGILAGSIAHDFSNFVSVIEGYADILLNRMTENDPLRQFVERIHQTNKQAALLIRQIQSFSRRQSSERLPVNPNEAIEEISEILTRLIGKHIKIDFQLGKDIGLILADKMELGQAIMNMVINARDAMPEGGTLTIKTSRCTKNEQTATASAVAKGDYTCIEITDTGSGMDESTLQRIFDPFFTTKPRDKGTGLGLSIVYNIVKNSNGHIDVQSVPGRGTTFRLYFPVVSQKQ